MDCVTLLKRFLVSKRTKCFDPKLICDGLGEYKCFGGQGTWDPNPAPSSPNHEKPRLLGLLSSSLELWWGRRRDIRGILRSLSAVKFYSVLQRLFQDDFAKKKIKHSTWKKNDVRPNKRYQTLMMQTFYLKFKILSEDCYNFSGSGYLVFSGESLLWPWKMEEKVISKICYLIND